MNTLQKTCLFVLCFALFNCKNNNQTINFSKLTQDYFNDKNKLFPLEATVNGQNQYNDQLQFEMTDSFREKQAAFYNKYAQHLQTVNYEALSEEEKNSFDIIKWEIDRGNDVLQTSNNLLPIHQFWGTHLTMAQFAEGSSAQPFKTEKDYRNFLKRIELYT